MFIEFIKKVFRFKWSVLGVLVFFTLVGAFEVKYDGRYFPFVTIAGESVGGRTYEEVSAEFKIKAAELEKNGFTLTLKNERAEKEIRVPMTAFGLTPDAVIQYFSVGDWDGIIKTAHDFGRRGTIWQRFSAQASLFFMEKRFDLPLYANNEAIKSLLAREMKNFFIEEVPAQFNVSGNKVVISPEKIGEDVNLESVMETLDVNFKSFQSSNLVLVSHPKVPYVTEEKLIPYIGLAEGLSKSANVSFNYKSRKWKVIGKTLITWLTIKDDGEIGIDVPKLDKFLAKTVAPLINNPPQNSRFEIQQGKLVEIFPGKSGYVVDVKKTAAKVEAIIPSVQENFSKTGSVLSALASLGPQVSFVPQTNTINVPIEIIEADPEVTQKTIDQYEIRELVGYAETGFAGSSADRKSNIRNGVSKLTGQLIAPGQEFSTIRALGPITEEAGFVKEFVIREVRNVKEMGGGLCQLGSTLFNTILDAGLPVTERAAHKYTIKYYVTGLDATIYSPHPDLRFINDTGNYLLLQGRVFGDKVAFELYGASDGRTASVSEPVLSNPRPVPPTRYVEADDVAEGETQCMTGTKEGITADATYTINYPDGSVKTQRFHSVYEAWPQVCLVGTAKIDSPSPVSIQ